MNKTESPKRFNINTFLMMIIAGVIGGAISAGIMAYINNNDYQQEVMTVDLKPILEYKRNDMSERYKGELTEDTERLAEKEIESFTLQLKEKLIEYSKHGLVLSKDVVLGESIDMTDDLLNYMKNTRITDNSAEK